MIMRRQSIAENQADIRNTPLDKYYKIFYESYLKYHKNNHYFFKSEKQTKLPLF